MRTAMFPDIDRKYWKVKDKEWMAERQAKWKGISLRIEYECLKSRKAMNLLQRYYLRGELPDFELLKHYRDDYRHIDLLDFIWLHPSRDKELLRSLRNQYINSSLVMKADVTFGMDCLLISGVGNASRRFYGDDEEIQCIESHRQKYGLYTGENEFLFEILADDLIASNFEELKNQKWSAEMFRAGFEDLNTLAAMLELNSINYIHRDSLFQYNNYIEYWYRSIIHPARFATQIKHVRVPAMKRELGNSLLQIYQFYVSGQGESFCLEAARKFCELFDNRKISDDFSEFWEDIKTGRYIAQLVY